MLILKLKIISGTNSKTCFFTRQQLYDIMKSSNEHDLEKKLDFMEAEVKKRTEPSEDDLCRFQEIMKNLRREFRTRWQDAKRTEARFLERNAIWLNSSTGFPCRPQLKRGRKKTDFEECCTRTKNRKTKDLRESTPLPMLTHATQASLRASGNIEASKLIKEIMSSPTRAEKYRKSLNRPVEMKMSGDEALSMLVEAQLSVHQYNVIQKSSPQRFPCYSVVQLAKKQCYPKEDSITVCETSAEISLQELLNHTVDRLLMVQKPFIDTLGKNELNNLCLYAKWGFDGSSGHSAYKQAFLNPEASDASVFITSIVPLRLECGNIIVWQNPRPASTRFCRPLKISFVKETATISKQEKARVEEEIKHLTDSVISVGDNTIKVRHNLILSMIDGKVCNAITETTSTQKCFLCGATSNDFNRIDDMIMKEVKTENLQFGLSVLHGWIRFFECLLHISYKLPIKKWQARTMREKQIVAETKERIQKAFMQKAGLIVDKPKPGFGSTNDGNTARRFFQNAELSADITGIKKDLIKKMHTMLIAVSCGHDIDEEKFREFAHQTARCFVHYYPWYNMTPTLHKFFIHGPEIIRNALLPIGQLTEEAQEARNKDFKRYRERFSRKINRKQSNRDVLNMLLVTSDPVISSMRKLPRKKLQTLPKEALELLKPPSIQNKRDNNDWDNDDEDFACDEDSDDVGNESDDEYFA